MLQTEKPIESLFLTKGMYGFVFNLFMKPDIRTSIRYVIRFEKGIKELKTKVIIPIRNLDLSLFKSLSKEKEIN